MATLAHTQIEAEAGDYFALMKPTVMSLVLWSGFVGLMLAPHTLPVASSVAALLFMAMGAGGSAALNMWYESHLDGRMERTKNRPIPAGRMDRGEALGFGIFLSGFSIVAMGVFVNWLASSLLAGTIVFYVLIYTMLLKPSTAQNIVIGGAAGAVPPMIGWAAASDSLSLMPLYLFLIIFIWTPPHFWPLALKRKGEYKSVGVPMMPSVAGSVSTANQILFYSVGLFGVSLLPMTAGAGVPYGVVAIVLGLEFVRRAIVLRRAIETPKEERAALGLFFYSMIYLFVLLAALLVDNFIQGAL